ncbi:MAG: enoyl-CoA hydratase/isomerase family protein [Chloroflexota bacterium]
MQVEQILGVLIGAGLAEHDAQGWLEAAPPRAESAEPDRAIDAHWLREGTFIHRGEALYDRLPPRRLRTKAELLAAETISKELRDCRLRFLRDRSGDAYAALTGNLSECVRVDELVARAAIRFPGLTPSVARMQLEGQRALRDKETFEIDQGNFLWQILSHPASGAHLVQSMLRPLPEAQAMLEQFRADGRSALELADVSREGNVGVVELRNTDFLNAEDNDTNRSLEIGVDLVIMDPEIDVCVLRGAPVQHSKYRGRRVFNSGLNLTRLYEGRIPFLFYMTRDLGLVNKIYRGHAPETHRPWEGETGQEKPWIAAVETFAIGGGCQLLLVMDHVLAEQGTFFSLPARKEGIIPGAANLRLPRLVGDRMARRGILFDQPFPVVSDGGRLLCDDVVPFGGMDQAITQVCERLSSSGLVSVSGNRKAIRVAQEPLSVFQSYMATYAREQVLCHVSSALSANLEQHWLSRGNARPSQMKSPNPAN